jgi:carbamoyltransferase
MKSYNILSVNFNHDGSAIILSDGKIKAFVNTERFSKKKKHPGIRKEDLYNLLDQAGLGLKDIHVAILCNLNNMDSPDIPILHGSSLKETWPDFWVYHSMEKMLIDGVEVSCMINPHHHLLHCSLAYFTSPFDEAICFSWDPTGYGAFIGKKNKIQRLPYKLRPFNSCLWYEKTAVSLFGTGILGAGKVMGLAPYGGQEQEVETLFEIGTLDELYRRSGNGNAVILREEGRELNATLAFNVQKIMDVQLSRVLNELYEIAQKEGIRANLCLSGGGALNSVSNQLAFENSMFDRIHIHPASGDDGTAIGAALYYWFDRLGNERREFSNRELMYSILTYEDSIEDILSKPRYRELLIVERSPDYIARTAALLADNKIVGWFQDSSEIGPRALGNRSILADPRNPEMKEILNRRIKFRENFRPFAPAVLNEHAEKWFGLKDSPFMLRVCRVLEQGAPAISHVDNTARIQTISREDNLNFYELISAFHAITGVPLLINTSFNTKGQPIVESAADAIECFLHIPLDALVFKNIILRKSTKVSTFPAGI